MFGVPSAYADSVVKHGRWESFTLNQGDYINGCAIIGNREADISIRFAYTEGFGSTIDLTIKDSSYVKNDLSFLLKYGDKTRIFSDSVVSYDNNEVTLSNDSGLKTLSDIVDELQMYENINISSKDIKTTNMLGMYKNNIDISLSGYKETLNDFYSCIEEIKKQDENNSKK
ncbi:hypothetical protein M2305_003254 [Gluconobacter cerinus]|uniref:hypothetical protein n=1 Tax=Gluconobacter cerinus TaxID=38307 RepID=UPI002227564F|nr:hypothetical protein [Gluconobacter cerinus]MCW2267235.1 hypothetical protein [Gluconobacter cerinus]